MPSAGNKQAPLAGKLEAARRELLDLGLRNTLLNYRSLRARGIDIIDEKPVEVFRLLVCEEKHFTFLADDVGTVAAGGRIRRRGAARRPPAADALHIAATAVAAAQYLACGTYLDGGTRRQYVVPGARHGVMVRRRVAGEILPGAVDTNSRGTRSV